MSPVHISPNDTIGIPLVIEMINSVRKDKPVGVIVPTVFWRKMNLRAERIYIFHFVFAAENAVKHIVGDIPLYLDVLTEIPGYVH